MSTVQNSLNRQKLQKEVQRRRTFAIISHPDAGKTTLTEKLLLYSGAIEEAGSVRARKNQRAVTSDWMAMEQQRGISITSTVLQFERDNILFNLLDTPGHQDFSEDTYRTLIAADSAVMVLDSANGIESQTRKLFEVCRQRHLPILTFINKLDNYGRDPLDLLDEIEQMLDIQVTPINWPVGQGHDFKGIYDIAQQRVLLFERTAHGKYRAPLTVTGLHDPSLVKLIGQNATDRLREDVELVTMAGSPFDKELFLAGKLTPIYFGSALNNFGVEKFLEALVDLAPPPMPRESDAGYIDPAHDTFSGFVFKIQANMDPRHRDRMAFLRICSGRFEKDMSVHNPRSGQTIRMSRPHRLFAQDRETVEEAYPGDIVGLSNPGVFAIGDTVCGDGDSFAFTMIPPFQPELFAILRNESMDKYKQFNKGIEQLREEGVVRIFYPVDTGRREPILAAVGELQFDVVIARMEAEYNVETRVQHLSYALACWIEGDLQQIKDIRWPSQSMRTRDEHDQLVVLFDSKWQVRYTMQDNPDIVFKEISGKPINLN
ncbi:MAG: peptide chain release factor 3 [Anaerolineae bacterium]